MWPPYLIVVGGSLVLALLELMATFRRSVGDVLRSRWGLALFGLNASAAVALYLAARLALGVGNDVATAVVVAATYPTLLRNPLTFFKVNTGREGDFQRSSIDLISRLYEALLTHCKTEALVWDADRRARKAERLLSRYAVGFLEQQVRSLIQAQQDPELRTQHEKMLAKTLAVPDRADREQAVALVLIDIATSGRIEELLRGA
ncbi:MAG: hypothetical protein HY660_12130 [Armatimonadetes bacterium]|nr:hypothetical protein [Armatimonadota bacterium]